MATDESEESHPKYSYWPTPNVAEIGLLARHAPHAPPVRIFLRRLHDLAAFLAAAHGPSVLLPGGKIANRELFMCKTKRFAENIPPCRPFCNSVWHTSTQQSNFRILGRLKPCREYNLRHQWFREVP